MKKFLGNMLSIACGVLLACLLYDKSYRVIDKLKNFDVFAGMRRKKEETLRMDLNECDGKCDECVREACADPYD